MTRTEKDLMNLTVLASHYLEERDVLLPGQYTHWRCSLWQMAWDTSRAPAIRALALELFRPAAKEIR